MSPGIKLIYYGHETRAVKKYQRESLSQEMQRRLNIQHRREYAPSGLQVTPPPWRMDVFLHEEILANRHDENKLMAVLCIVMLHCSDVLLEMLERKGALYGDCSQTCKNSFQILPTISQIT